MGEGPNREIEQYYILTPTLRCKKVLVAWISASPEKGQQEGVGWIADDGRCPLLRNLQTTTGRGTKAIYRDT